MLICANLPICANTNICRQYNWTRVGTLYQNEAKYSLVRIYFQTISEKGNVNYDI